VIDGASPPAKLNEVERAADEHYRSIQARSASVTASGRYCRQMAAILHNLELRSGDSVRDRQGY
jgi:hypothetical protein